MLEKSCFNDFQSKRKNLKTLLFQGFSVALTTLFDTIRRFGDSVAIAIFIYIIIKPAFAKKTRKNAKTGHLGDYFLFI